MNCIWKNVASWKKLYLSKGGRLTLVKITLFSLPTYYYLSLFCCLLVSQKTRKGPVGLLMGGIGDMFKFHLVN